MEIERKFLVKRLPEELGSFEHREIEQSYVSTEPVIRVRRTDSRYTLTVKGSGLMAREELNLPITRESFERLKKKAEGLTIKKTRWLIPFGAYTIELDVFTEPRELIMAEVEFPTQEEALAFTPPDWFGEDVTADTRYHNSTMSRGAF